MTPSFAEQLMIDCMTAQGLDAASAEKAARVVFQVGTASGLMHQREIDAFERDAHIYKLMGMHVTATSIGQRMNISRAGVFRAIRRHTRARRTVLKLIA